MPKIYFPCEIILLCLEILSFTIKSKRNTVVKAVIKTDFKIRGDFFLFKSWLI